MKTIDGIWNAVPSAKQRVYRTWVRQIRFDRDSVCALWCPRFYNICQDQLDAWYFRIVQ